jgi:UDP-glucose 4-epimerase
MGKIALIGGSGFIGSHTADLLRRLGRDYVILDMNRPTDPTHPYRYCDITTPRPGGFLEEQLRDVDIVYMLAAISNSHDCRRDPLHALKTNIHGLAQTLDCCKLLDVKRIIFASSVWVYSTVEEEDVDEDTCLCANKSKHIYTSSKLAGEMMIRSYGIDYTILRYGIAYGPGANTETAMSMFLNNIRNNKSIQIYGDGEQFRSFMYVTDHAYGNIAALSNKAINQTINLCPTENTSLNDIVNMLSRTYKFEVEYKPAIENDYRGKNVNNVKAKQLLNWSPEVSFKDGFEMYVRD